MEVKSLNLQGPPLQAIRGVRLQVFVGAKNVHEICMISKQLKLLAIHDQIIASHQRLMNCVRFLVYYRPVLLIVGESLSIKGKRLMSLFVHRLVHIFSGDLRDNTCPRIFTRIRKHTHHCIFSRICQLNHVF